MLGKVGESLVGLTGQKTKILVDGRTPIPDGLTGTTLTEVKNVQNLSYTQQLRDFGTYAQQNNLTYNLFVRPDTTLSKPLQDAVQAGDVVLNTIPGL